MILLGCVCCGGLALIAVSTRLTDPTKYHEPLMCCDVPVTTNEVEAFTFPRLPGVRVRPVRTRSPFEKYRGIGIPGIARSRKAVVRWVRGLRGR